MADNTPPAPVELPPDLPTLYMNGFALSVSNADMIILAQRNGHPAMTINLSFTLAKTLQLALSRLISDFQAATDHEVMTTHVIEPALLKMIRDKQDA